MPEKLTQELCSLVDKYELSQVVDTLAQVAYDKYVAPEPDNDKSDRVVQLLEEASEIAKA